MADIDVIMPQMGESITEGTLVKWLKHEGDAVKRDEPLFEISTEKVDVEIPAPASGVLRAIKVKEGETVPVNTVVAVIGKEGAAGATAEKPAAPEKAAAPSEKAAAAPAAPAAKTVAAPAAPAEKAAAPAAAPAAGAERSGKGDVVVSMDARRRGAGEAANVAAEQGDAHEPEEGEEGEEGLAAEAAEPLSREERRQVRSSPLVRKMAREHGVDLASVPGTGISGRVTKDDLLRRIQQGAPRPAAAQAPAPAGRVAAPAGRATGAAGPTLAGRVEPLSTMRKRIAEHMVASRRTSAHVATVFEMDMNRVHALREKHKRAFEEQHATKLTYTALIARAVVRTLLDFPVLNASIDGDNVVYHPHVNLGMAVALDWGLIVPVIKSAEEKNTLGIQRSITDLAERARVRKLLPDEVQGGTFTITNPGIYGGLFGTPIINQPQVAILGLGVIEKRPVVIDDAIAIRPMCYFALSFDHRLIDGAVADQFMAQLKKALQTLEDVG